MDKVKDYTRIIIIVLVTTIIGHLISIFFQNNDKIGKSATKKELIIVEEKANAYTNEQIINHEKNEVLRYDKWQYILNQNNILLKELHEKVIRHDERLNNPNFKTSSDKKHFKL